MGKDPTCPMKLIDKFLRYIKDILKIMSIEDDQSDTVETLMKIESKLLDLCEARNYLVMKDQLLMNKNGVFVAGTDRAADNKTIEMFEKELNKERMDKIVKQKQQEKSQ